MSLLIPLLMIASTPLDGAAPPAPQSRGPVVVTVRARAEILRAERADPEAGEGALARRVLRRGDGQVMVEFD